MSNWLADTLNSFLAKLGLPIQDWQQSPQLSLQFDNDINSEINVLEDTIVVSFLTPVLPADQTQVLRYLCRNNVIHTQKNPILRHHWYNDQAVIQVILEHSDVTEIALEQLYSQLLSASQSIKAM